ncbi:fam-a protein [Plasmodium vinckei brucechwatti]|uniref:Fam-a protein n=1 Tax=Plasmodium vinckei brucechwatti TaxID=119398 RepID=A0A6V7RU34_PLAVN|nr:fam-a protein [Plasmodium vinckei brucechwatti]
MNKIYIKIALALLSVAGYMQNIAFASEYTTTTTSSNEEDKQQVSIDHEEAIEAKGIMADALALAKLHAKCPNNYKIYHKEDEEAIIYFKKLSRVDIGKLELTIHNPDSYDDIVNMLWDPNGPKNYDDLFDKGSIFRTYNENLVIVQQHYDGSSGTLDLHCHALASKFQLSEDETAIVFAPSDMSGPGSDSYQTYENTIVESASMSESDIYSEENIKYGKLSQIFVNLVAFFIKKEADCVKITHISSIEHGVPLYVPYDFLELLTIKKMINVINLRDIFKKK